MNFCSCFDLEYFPFISYTFDSFKTGVSQIYTYVSSSISTLLPFPNSRKGDRYSRQTMFESYVISKMKRGEVPEYLLDHYKECEIPKRSWLKKTDEEKKTYLDTRLNRFVTSRQVKNKVLYQLKKNAKARKRRFLSSV